MNCLKVLEKNLPTVILFLFVLLYFVHAKKQKKKLPEPEDDEEDFEADVFCKTQSRLIKFEKADEIFVVDTSVNNSILLQCKYCEEKDNGMPKTWSKQKHIFTGNITELETSMDNNATYSSLFISKKHSLVFRNLQETDMGLYFCRAPYADTPDKSFNYLIDLNNKTVNDVSGTITDLKNYTKLFFETVNKIFANKTYALQEITVNMKVFTDWTEWSECDSCFRKEGIRFRLGKCRVKPICREANRCMFQRQKFKSFVFSDLQNSERPTEVDGEIANASEVEKNIMEFGIPLYCRSFLLLKLFREVYNMTADIPDFVLNEKCSTPCKGRSLKKGARYRKSIILAKGAHLTLVCPDCISLGIINGCGFSMGYYPLPNDASLGKSLKKNTSVSISDSEVRWEHNKLRLHPNEGIDYIPGTTEPRIYVDSFNTLYLFEVTDRESGNFTCFVNGIRMQEVKIIVLTRSLFFTKEFTRHLKYLGFVFLICFIGYLAGILVMCVKSHSSKKKNNRKFHPDTETLLKEDPESESDV